MYWKEQYATSFTGSLDSTTLLLHSFRTSELTVRRAAAAIFMVFTVLNLYYQTIQVSCRHGKHALILFRQITRLIIALYWFRWAPAIDDAS